ncbi:MAG TPA: class I SAM-dependent methyltransferase [Gaiellaceae bacterium]|jgi:SAM-dependent methyltransferase
MRWRRTPERGGRLPSLGQDFTEGHRSYVRHIGPAAELWLRTKPFSAPAGRELVECLRTFAHIVDRLGLGLRDQVLDVGCGPGWLSEFLARCGYAVTGVDVSEDMVAIARRRLDGITEPVGVGIEAVGEFHAMPVLELPWKARFDAAILYDAMHHFDDEAATLEVIRRTLVPGGRIFIHEGVRPEPGSEGEQFLIDEMREYGTLESPFDAEYLVAVVRKAGFTDVARFAALDELLDVSASEEELRRVQARVQYPPMNTVVAVNPTPVEQAFAARIELGAWREAADGDLTLGVTVTNAGRCYWPNELGSTVQHGVVTLGPYVGDGGERVELPRSPLPRGLSSGESVETELRVARAELEGRKELRVDLVREGIAWFAECGSEPVVIPLPADG